MNAARRDKRKRDWPRGLYEPRPGYFIFRQPDGKVFALGRIPCVNARAEAIAGNAHLAAAGPGLVDRLSGAGQTVADLLDIMPAADRPNTAKSWRSLDKRIRAALGAVAAGALTTKHCADMLEAVETEGKARLAEALRSRLMAVCQKGQTKGWMKDNPAMPTAVGVVEVQRGRLTLAAFLAIHSKAPEVAEWLQHAMMLALVTGADRSSIAALQRADAADGYLTITRAKTGVQIAVPTVLRLDCVGVSVADLLAHRTGVVSRHLVHHVNPWGNAPAGSKVHPDRISHAFTEARKLAGIPDDGAPTFHEIRSLATRLYTEQGGVDTKALLGHATEKMSALYADPRGVEPIRVRVG